MTLRKIVSILILLCSLLWCVHAEAGVIDNERKTADEIIMPATDTLLIMSNDKGDTAYQYFDGGNLYLSSGSDTTEIYTTFMKIGIPANNWGCWLRNNSGTLEYSNDSGLTWNEVGAGGTGGLDSGEIMVVIRDSTYIDTGLVVTILNDSLSLADTVAAYSINDADLSDSSITLLNATAWRIFYSNATTTAIQELALGADGTYLKSNGASAAPTWATPAGGSGFWDTLSTNDSMVWVAGTDTTYFINFPGDSLKIYHSSGSLILGDGSGILSGDSVLSRSYYSWVLAGDTTQINKAQIDSILAQTGRFAGSAGIDSNAVMAIIRDSTYIDTALTVKIISDSISFADSVAAYETAETGTTDSVYINVGGATQYGPFTNDMYKIKEGLGIDISRSDSTTYDVFYIEASLGANITSSEIVNQTIVADDIDSTAEPFTFSEVFKGNGAVADSAFLTAGYLATLYQTILADAALVSEAELEDSLNSYFDSLTVNLRYKATRDSVAAWDNGAYPFSVPVSDSTAGDADTLGTQLAAALGARTTDTEFGPISDSVTSWVDTIPAVAKGLDTTGSAFQTYVANNGGEGTSLKADTGTGAPVSGIGVIQKGPNITFDVDNDTLNISFDVDWDSVEVTSFYDPMIREDLTLEGFFNHAGRMPIPDFSKAYVRHGATGTWIDTTQWPLLSDSAVHPSVIVIPQGWPDDGDPHIVMKVEGMPDARENPWILSSYDGITWTTPQGASNPVLEPSDFPTGCDHLSDGAISLTPDGNLFLIERVTWQSTAEDTNKLYYIETADGVAYSDTTLLLTAINDAGLMSPTHLRYVDNTSGLVCVTCDTATDTCQDMWYTAPDYSGPYTLVDSGRILSALPDSVRPWHMYINQLTPNVWMALVNTKRTGSVSANDKGVWGCYTMDAGATWSPFYENEAPLIDDNGAYYGSGYWEYTGEGLRFVYYMSSLALDYYHVYKQYIYFKDVGYTQELDQIYSRQLSTDSVDLRFEQFAANKFYLVTDTNLTGSVKDTIGFAGTINRRIDTDSLILIYGTTGAIDSITGLCPADSAGAWEIADSIFWGYGTNLTSASARVALPMNRRFDRGDKIGLKVFTTYTSAGQYTRVSYVAIKGHEALDE